MAFKYFHQVIQHAEVYGNLGRDFFNEIRLFRSRDVKMGSLRIRESAEPRKISTSIAAGGKKTGTIEDRV